MWMTVVGADTLIATTNNMTATGAAPKATKSHPIESWDDGLSPIYTYLHPLLLLGYFYYQFPSLVEEPVDTLPQTALAVAALQLIYLCICIPGSNHAQLPQRGKKRKASAAQGDSGIGAKLVVRAGNPFAARCILIMSRSPASSRSSSPSPSVHLSSPSLSSCSAPHSQLIKPTLSTAACTFRSSLHTRYFMSTASMLPNGSKLALLPPPLTRCLVLPWEH